MDKETSFRVALFSRDGQYLLRVRGIRLTPDSPEPWLAWAGLPALVNIKYKDRVFKWYIHREWNAAFALLEMLNEKGKAHLRRLMDSGQLVDCGPVPDAQRQTLRQLVSRTFGRGCRNTVPAGLSTEEDFRTLTQMLVREMLGRDPAATIYVSRCSARAGTRTAGGYQTHRATAHRARRQTPRVTLRAHPCDVRAGVGTSGL